MKGHGRDLRESNTYAYQGKVSGSRWGSFRSKKIASNNPDSSLVDTIGRCKYHHLTSILLLAHTVVVTEACCAARQFTVGHRFK